MSIELEYKFLVRKDEFDHIEAYLLSILPSYKTVKQTNFYYDTTDYLLFRSGVTCRIRCSDNKLNGALKIHRTLDSNENIELAFDVDKIANSISVSEIDLYLLGNVTTIRKVFKLSNEITIMLDENCYLGNTDFEIEIEYLEQNETNMQDLLSELDNLLLKYCSLRGYNTSSIYETSDHKSTRFINAKKNIDSNTNISINVKEKQ